MFFDILDSRHFYKIRKAKTTPWWKRAESGTPDSDSFGKFDLIAGVTAQNILFMKVSIELEAEDWISLSGLIGAFMKIAAPNIGNHPIAYSNSARLHNELWEQIKAKVPAEVFTEVVRRVKSTGTTFKAE